MLDPRKNFASNTQHLQRVKEMLVRNTSEGLLEIILNICCDDPCPQHQYKNRDALSNIHLTTSNTTGVDLVPTCPHCKCTFTARIGLIDNLCIHRTKTATSTTTITTTADDSNPAPPDLSCSHCDHTFTSHIGLVGHLRIHRTETDEPVPGA
ncbi:unnamed protein product [Schistocephalus solidus]|uniref:C2H2-type domain-containing protein n=1 Tax=Schistocephalus solidus TaxID=70667 RepID=A0A183SKC5_SCHSO|nr:unnamed protein product [Schistocephalus solidus]